VVVRRREDNNVLHIEAWKKPLSPPPMHPSLQAPRRAGAWMRLLIFRFVINPLDHVLVTIVSKVRVDNHLGSLYLINRSMPLRLFIS